MGAKNLSLLKVSKNYSAEIEEITKAREKSANLAKAEAEAVKEAITKFTDLRAN